MRTLSEMLAATSRDTIIRVWDLTQLDREPRTSQGHTYDVMSILFNPDSNYLWSAGRDGEVSGEHRTSGRHSYFTASGGKRL